MKAPNALALMTVAIPAIGGCGLIELPPPPDAIAINECNPDEDGCGSGECSRALNACVANSDGTLRTLVLQVIPPAGTPSGGGVPFFVKYTVESGNADVTIPPIARVNGKVSIPPSTESASEACALEGKTPGNIVLGAADGTVPVSVSFTPSERVLGISAASYAASSPTEGFEGSNPPQAGSHRFSAELPPGRYDIYIEPRKRVSGSCEVLPLLLRNRQVAGDLEVTLPVASSLPLAIRVPSAPDAGLEGWTVDLIDPRTSRVLSTRETLSEGVLNSAGDAREYLPTLRFSTAFAVSEDGTLEKDSSAEEIVRLSPPEGAVEPTLLFQRSALGLLADPSVPALIDLTVGEGNATRYGALPESVTIHGQTASVVDSAPVQAAVTLMAKSLEGLGPTFASFVRTVQADARGLFDVSVPPGTYEVRAVAESGLELSTARAEWQIASAPAHQYGKVIEFSPRTFIDGTVAVAGSQRRAYGASVRATASPLHIQVDALRAALGDPPLVPFASNTIVAGDGYFHLSADPGVFDFFVQPEPRSRYPWYVRPATEVTAEGRLLNDARVPFPVIRTGRVVVGEGEEATSVPNALLRAYAHVGADGKYLADPTGVDRVAAVQVAETRADENGGFELLIPASLDSRR